MKVIIHYGDEDSIALEADTLEELRELAWSECEKRGWDTDCCWSEVLRNCPKEREENEMNSYYLQGLNDAWDFFKELLQMTWADRREAFCDENIHTLTTLFNEHTPTECLVAMEKWRDKIRIGDEVYIKYLPGLSFVVTSLDGGVYGIDERGNYHGCGANEADFIKTGRHFDEVEELLEEMKDDEDE